MFPANTPDYQSLMQLLDAAQMGWWKADFQSGKLLFSPNFATLLGLEMESVSIDKILSITRKDYRTRIRRNFMRLKVEDHFDETFPMILPCGEVWLHAQLVGRQSASDTGTLLYGYVQRVSINTEAEAETLTLESNYHAALKEIQHMDEVLDNLPIGYFRIRLLYDSTGRPIDYLFLAINRASQSILGINPEDYIDHTARELGINIDKHIGMLASIGLSEYKTFEWRSPKSNRSCRGFLYNTPNDASEIVLLVLDITDLVTAHQTLDEQQKLMRNIILNAPVGIEIYDREGLLVDINARDMEIFGVKDAQEIIGASIYDNPNFSESTKARIRKGQGFDIVGRYDFETVRKYYNTTRKGSFDWTGHIRFLYNDRNEITHYLIINIDNSELLLAQSRLAEFEELFRTISEYSQVGYANYNLCTKEGYAQGVWLRNYGELDTAQITDVVGIYRHIYPEERRVLLDALEKFRSGEIRSTTIIGRILHDDGHTHWIKSHLICREYKPQEGVIDMLGINYDITALKQSEVDLIAAKERAEEANKLKSAFLANMSHEIRTPLNAIVGFSGLLAEEESSEQRRTYANIVSFNNDLLLQIISDVLDLARIESGRVEVVRTYFDARELCHNLVGTFRLQALDGVEVLLEEELPSLIAYEYDQGITQIISNFIRNAIKFTTQGSITVGFGQHSEWLRFYVRDTGIGIPPEQCAHIFERFYKVDSFTQGTGLGLAISKSIAEQLGGRIGVDSEVGIGSCFWIEIPAAK